MKLANLSVISGIVNDLSVLVIVNYSDVLIQGEFELASINELCDNRDIGIVCDMVVKSVGKIYIANHIAIGNDDVVSSAVFNEVLNAYKRLKTCCIELVTAACCTCNKGGQNSDTT